MAANARVVQLARTRAHARAPGGFTLIELLAALAVLGILIAIAAPSYRGYVERGRIAQVCGDFSAVEVRAVRFYADHKRYPDTLAEIGQDSLRDPWGRPYAYLNLTVPANLNDARKDKNLHPINTDFDLYSVGADGQSVKPLTAQRSQDDLIRARNGAYCGYVRDYN